MKNEDMEDKKLIKNADPILQRVLEGDESYKKWEKRLKKLAQSLSVITIIGFSVFFLTNYIFFGKVLALSENLWFLICL
ncbi:MAG: hypothetical protein QHH19_06615, partial [Candidatus Thermoplasmatota archaeon]|nr:hypothetical protein [Candidatus Thermoplasmatota archaeon]